jgi:hypothetical protein
MIFAADGSGFVGGELIPAGARLWFGILPDDSSTAYFQHPDAPTVRISVSPSGFGFPLRGSEFPDPFAQLFLGAVGGPPGEVMVWLRSPGFTGDGLFLRGGADGPSLSYTDGEITEQLVP